jgi:hypothetical protein
VVDGSERRRDLRARLEELGGLAVDDLEIALLSRVRVARVHELQHLALGDDVGRLGHDLHDPLRADGGHHLEGPRVHEIAHQDARRVAVDGVGGVPAAAALGAVDHIVMQQGRRMDELDEGRSVDMARPAVTAGPGGEQHDQRPQALAAAGDDVLGDLVHEGNRALHAGADDGIHGDEVVADQFLDRR